MAGRPILGVKKPASALPTTSSGRVRHRVLIIDARYYDAIADAASTAWNRLCAEAGRIRSLCSYPWIPKVKT